MHVRTRVALFALLFVGCHAAYAQNLVITNANPQITLPLAAGSALAFNDGEGPRQIVPESELLNVLVQCELDAQGQCAFASNDNLGGFAVVFSNTFQSVRLKLGTSLQYSRILPGGALDQVQVNQPQFVDVRCAVDGNGKCIGIPAPPPPTVSLALSD
jgi:hypothetical protein